MFKHGFKVCLNKYGYPSEYFCIIMRNALKVGKQVASDGLIIQNCIKSKFTPSLIAVNRTALAVCFVYCGC